MGRVDLEERVARLEAELSLLKFQNSIKNDSLLARIARRHTNLYEFLQPQWLPLAKYDPTTNAAYPKGRIGVVTSDGVFRSILHIDGTDAVILAGDFAAISKNVYVETGFNVLSASAPVTLSDTSSAQAPSWRIDSVSNLLRFLYAQTNPSVTQVEIAELSNANNPVYWRLFNAAGTERIAMRTGTGGNRGVLRLWDVTKAAFSYAYLDNGAWVIAASEPT